MKFKPIDDNTPFGKKLHMQVKGVPVVGIRNKEIDCIYVYGSDGWNEVYYPQDFKKLQWLDESKNITLPEPKWISFTKIGPTASGLTFIYQVRSKENPNVLLGEIKWYPAFRCYSFYPQPHCVFETKCMEDIIAFIEFIMHMRNKKNDDQELQY